MSSLCTRILAVGSIIQVAVDIEHVVNIKVHEIFPTYCTRTHIDTKRRTDNRTYAFAQHSAFFVHLGYAAA